MKFLLPPYTKYHIISFGLFALFIGVAGILYLPNLNSVTQTEVIASSPAEIKSDFSEPLALAQSDLADTAWANYGFLLLDLRKPNDYATAHITGAISAPVEQLAYGVYGKDDDIVLYSTSQQDIDSSIQILSDMGVTKVRAIVDSLDTLKGQGYEIENK